jgi:hypothetical protein
MMLRDIMRCVSSACCAAAVMMCASGVLGMVEVADGVEKLNMIPVSSSFDKFKAIDFDFCRFLSGSRSSSTRNWSEEIQNISQNISDLLMATSDSDIRYAYGSIYGICSYRFNDFCNFCSTLSEKSLDRHVVVSFLTLIPRVLASLPSAEENGHTAKAFSEFLANVSLTSSTLVTSSSRSLFKEVAYWLRPMMIP